MTAGCCCAFRICVPAWVTYPIFFFLTLFWRFCFESQWSGQYSPCAELTPGAFYYSKTERILSKFDGKTLFSELLRNRYWSYKPVMENVIFFSQEQWRFDPALVFLRFWKGMQMYPAPFCYDATTLVKITSSSFQTVWMQGGLCWGSPSEPLGVALRNGGRHGRSAWNIVPRNMLHCWLCTLLSLERSIVGRCHLHPFHISKGAILSYCNSAVTYALCMYKVFPCDMCCLLHFSAESLSYFSHPSVPCGFFFPPLR